TGDEMFPGLPGWATLDNGTGNATMEITAYLEFPAAGQYTMGVNSDDGFRVTAGKDVLDRLGILLGQFNAGRGASDTLFNFVIEQPGIYPFRLLWENGGGGANLEWFTLHNGTKILVNDTANANAIKAYRTSTKAYPYVQRVIPGITDAGIAADAEIQIEILDQGTSIDPASVQLELNGQSVSATATKSGNRTTVKFAPGILPSNSTNVVRVTYSDNASPKNTLTGEWFFVVTPYSVLPAELASPIGSGSGAGFRARVHQADQTGAVVLANLVSRAEQQLLDLFGPNVADLSTAANGVFDITTVINWNQDSGIGAEQGNFRADSVVPMPDAPIPGIPGATTLANRTTDDIAAEIVTYIEIPQAGFYTMGVNSDDGFRVTAAETAGPRIGAVEVVSPATIAGRIGAISAGSDGGGIARPMPTTPITAELVYVAPNEGCTPFTNADAVRGKIALIDRGTCAFSQKIQNAEAAGALAVIIVNSRDASHADGIWPFIMGGTAVNLPAVMITKPDGDKLKAALTQTITVTLGEDPTPYLGQFNGGRGASDTLFSFVATKPGVYPFRCVWFEGEGGANIEWFTVTKTGEKVLVNDTTNVNALKAFRSRTAPVTPTISVGLSGSDVVVTYTGVLQSADKVEGPYSDVTGATSPHRVPANTAGNKFWRA
ncbi:MAG: PA domain-containing protein, partial [Verrucomicrobiota bacterium]